MGDVTIETYNSIAKKYQEMFQNDFSEKEYYDKFLETINGKKILDVGCWIWNYTNYIFEQWFDVLWVDYSDKMLNIAQNKYPDISFVKMDMLNIQLSEKYSGIVCANSLFHIPKNDISNVLYKFYELLERDGKILFILLGWKGEWFQREPINDNLSLFVNYYSMDEFIEILNNVWFFIVYKNMEKINTPWELWNNKMIFIVSKT